MRGKRALLAFPLILALAGCGQGNAQIAVPREPGPDAAGYFCGMTLKEHKGPKGQILHKGWKDPLWFSSVRDALAYVEQEIVSDREMAGFWVNDMGAGTWDMPAPGSWIEAKSAWYVVGSTKSSGMGSAEAVPFKERSAADAFVKAFGGQVADYATARRHTSESDASHSGDGGGA